MSQQEAQIPNRRAFDNWNVIGPIPRILAFACDGVFAAILVIVGMLLIKKPFYWLQFTYLWVLTLWAWEGFWLTLTGTTPGRRPFGVSVYSPRTDGIPHPIQVCLRILTFWISVLMIGAGLTPILFRRDRRGWHDLISETLTVGKEKQLPTPFGQKIGQSLLLFQSLTVFSIFGAILLSTGTGHMALTRQEKAAFSCDNQELLLKKTPEVLLALAIAPSWNECFPRLLSAMGPISDSQLARLAQVATKYYELWTHSEAYRSQFYAKEIQAREDELCAGARSFEDVCKTARSLASVTVGSEAEELGWLANYEDIARTLSRETLSARRIDYLKEAISRYSDPIVNSALKDRLWSEQLALGLRPDSMPEGTANVQWLQDQYCWANALGFESLSTCRNKDLNEAVQAITDASQGGSIDETKDRLSRLELADHATEFSSVVAVLEAQNSQSTQAYDEKFNEISFLSPLRSKLE